MEFFVGHVLPCAAVYRFHNRSSVSAGRPTPEHRRRAPNTAGRRAAARQGSQVLDLFATGRAGRAAVCSPKQNSPRAVGPAKPPALI